MLNFESQPLPEFLTNGTRLLEGGGGPAPWDRVIGEGVRAPWYRVIGELGGYKGTIERKGAGGKIKEGKTCGADRRWTDSSVSSRAHDWRFEGGGDPVWSVTFPFLLNTYQTASEARKKRDRRGWGWGVGCIYTPVCPRPHGSRTI